MAILSVSKLWTARGGTDTFTRQRTYREQWEVITDSADDDEEVVAGPASGLPRLGQPHPRYPTARVVEINPEQSEETPFRWLVGIKYDSRFDLANSTSPDGASQDPENIPENPLLRPAEWRIALESNRTKAATHWRPVNAGNIAANFVPIVNSAKLPFDPPVQAEFHYPKIEITKNIPFVSLEFLMLLQDAINDRPWRTLPKWTAKIGGVSSRSRYENGVAFVELSVMLEINPDTWITQVLDAGNYELTQRTNLANGQQEQTWTEIKTPFGGEGPKPLNGQGRRLRPGDDPVFLAGLVRPLHLENFTALLNL